MHEDHEGISFYLGHFILNYLEVNAVVEDNAAVDGNAAADDNAAMEGNVELPAEDNQVAADHGQGWIFFFIHCLIF